MAVQAGEQEVSSASAISDGRFSLSLSLSRSLTSPKKKTYRGTIDPVVERFGGTRRAQFAEERGSLQPLSLARQQDRRLQRPSPGEFRECLDTCAKDCTLVGPARQLALGTMTKKARDSVR